MSSDREEDHRSVLATMASSAKAWCLSPRGKRTPTPDGSTPPHGTSSTYGPSQMAVNHCPQNPRQSPSTSAAWQLTAGPWPPSRWPAPPSPTPMPPLLRGPRKAITPPAIRSWPKRSRAGGIRRQRPVIAEALARIRETAQLVKGTPLEELDHRRGVAIPGERTHLSETKRASFRSRDYQGPKTVKLETGVEECFA